MSWIQARIYNKLTDRNLEKKDFYFYLWLAHKYQDNTKYEIAVERIMNFVYSRADVKFKHQMLLGLSDIVVLNDTVILFASDSEWWFGDNGIGLRTLTEETKLRVRLIEDRWSAKHDVREQYILNKV